MTMTAGAAGAPQGGGELDPRGAEALLAEIESLRPELEAAALEAEEERTLPAGIVARFRDLGVFWLKTPAELGGRPLHPIAFADLLEAVAYCEASSAWAMMIGCGSTGMAGGWLPDDGAAKVFASGADLPIVAGQPQPRGHAVRRGDGIVVTGRWGFASGIQHANWVLGAVSVDDGGDGAKVLIFVADKAHATVHDTWHVAGLQGTGSSDFSLEEVFLPYELTFERGSRVTPRGGPVFRQEGGLFVANEVPAFCVGVASRAIDDMVVMANQTARARGTSLSERGAFHKELGVATTRLTAARLYYRDAIGRAFDESCAGRPVPGDVQRAAMTAQAFVSETCVDIVSNLFRYAGGRALALSSPMQRHLRNLLAARQHLAATEEHYEVTGRALLEAWGDEDGRPPGGGLPPWL